MHRKITDVDLRNAAMAVGNHYLLTGTPFPVRLTHYEGEQARIDILGEGRLPPSDHGVAYVVSHIALLPDGHPLKTLYADMYEVPFKEPDPNPGTREFRASAYAARVRDDAEYAALPVAQRMQDRHNWDLFALDSRVRGQFAAQARVWLSWAHATRREYEKFITVVLKTMTGTAPLKKEIYFVEVTVAMLLETAHNTEFATQEETAAKLAELVSAQDTINATAGEQPEIQEVADHVDA